MGVEIVKSYSENIKGCKVCFVHAKLSNINEIATKVHDDIMDTSWLSKLKPLPKIAYEHRADRTVYKYMNLAYLSPKIIGDILEGEVPSHVNLQTLFGIAEKYADFDKQESAYYGC